MSMMYSFILFMVVWISTCFGQSLSPSSIRALSTRSDMCNLLQSASLPSYVIDEPCYQDVILGRVQNCAATIESSDWFAPVRQNVAKELMEQCDFDISTSAASSTAWFRRPYIDTRCVMLIFDSISCLLHIKSTPSLVASREAVLSTNQLNTTLLRSGRGMSGLQIRRSNVNQLPSTVSSSMLAIRTPCTLDELRVSLPQRDISSNTTLLSSAGLVQRPADMICPPTIESSGLISLSSMSFLVQALSDSINVGSSSNLFECASLCGRFCVNGVDGQYSCNNESRLVLPPYRPQTTTEITPQIITQMLPTCDISLLSPCSGLSHNRLEEDSCLPVPQRLMAQSRPSDSWSTVVSQECGGLNIKQLPIINCDEQAWLDSSRSFTLPCSVVLGSYLRWRLTQSTSISSIRRLSNVEMSYVRCSAQILAYHKCNQTSSQQVLSAVGLLTNSFVALPPIPARSITPSPCMTIVNQLLTRCDIEMRSQLATANSMFNCGELSCARLFSNFSHCVSTRVLALPFNSNLLSNLTTRCISSIQAQRFVSMSDPYVVRHALLPISNLSSDNSLVCDRAVLSTASQTVSELATCIEQSCGFQVQKPEPLDICETMNLTCAVCLAKYSLQTRSRSSMATAGRIQTIQCAHNAIAHRNCSVPTQQAMNHDCSSSCQISILRANSSCGVDFRTPSSERMRFASQYFKQIPSMICARDLATMARCIGNVASHCTAVQRPITTMFMPLLQSLVRFAEWEPRRCVDPCVLTMQPPPETTIAVGQQAMPSLTGFPVFASSCDDLAGYRLSYQDVDMDTLLALSGGGVYWQVGPFRRLWKLIDYCNRTTTVSQTIVVISTQQRCTNPSTLVLTSVPSLNGSQVTRVSVVLPSSDTFLTSLTCFANDESELSLARFNKSWYGASRSSNSTIRQFLARSLISEVTPLCQYNHLVMSGEYAITMTQFDVFGSTLIFCPPPVFYRPDTHYAMSVSLDDGASWFAVINGLKTPASAAGSFVPPVVLSARMQSDRSLAFEWSVPKFGSDTLNIHVYTAQPFVSPTLSPKHHRLTRVNDTVAQTITRTFAHNLGLISNVTNTGRLVLSVVTILSVWPSYMDDIPFTFFDLVGSTADINLAAFTAGNQRRLLSTFRLDPEGNRIPADRDPNPSIFNPMCWYNYCGPQATCFGYDYGAPVQSDIDAGCYQHDMCYDCIDGKSNTCHVGRAISAGTTKQKCDCDMLCDLSKADCAWDDAYCVAASVSVQTAFKVLTWLHWPPGCPDPCPPPPPRNPRPPPPPGGGASGDPHFTTLDGCRHSVQGFGDFVMMLDAVTGFEVQLRMTPAYATTTITLSRALCFRSSKMSPRFCIYASTSSPTIRVDGLSLFLPNSNSLTFPSTNAWCQDDVCILRNAYTVVLQWTSGHRAHLINSADQFSWTFHPSPLSFNRTDGLLGRWDGSRSREYRAGPYAENPSYPILSRELDCSASERQIYGWAHSWRTSYELGTSMFDFPLSQDILRQRSFRLMQVDHTNDESTFVPDFETVFAGTEYQRLGEIGCSSLSDVQLTDNCLFDASILSRQFGMTLGNYTSQLQQWTMSYIDYQQVRQQQDWNPVWTNVSYTESQHDAQAGSRFGINATSILSLVDMTLAWTGPPTSNTDLFTAAGLLSYEVESWNATSNSWYSIVFNRSSVLASNITLYNVQPATVMVFRIRCTVQQLGSGNPYRSTWYEQSFLTGGCLPRCPTAMGLSLNASMTLCGDDGCGRSCGSCPSALYCDTNVNRCAASPLRPNPYFSSSTGPAGTDGSGPSSLSSSTSSSPSSSGTPSSSSLVTTVIISSSSLSSTSAPSTASASMSSSTSSLLSSPFQLASSDTPTMPSSSTGMSRSSSSSTNQPTNPPIDEQESPSSSSSSTALVVPSSSSTGQVSTDINTSNRTPVGVYVGFGMVSLILVLLF